MTTHPSVYHVPAIPPSWLKALDVVAREALQRQDRTGPKLAEAVREVSDVYTRERHRLGSLPTLSGALAARLRFYLPRDLAKVAGPLEELAAARRLPTSRHWRVLDVGAGLGAMTLGVLLHAQAGGHVDSLQVHAVDSDARALDLLRRLGPRLVDQAGPTLDLRTERSDILRWSPNPDGSTYDLILVGFCLNELFVDQPDTIRIERRGQLLRSLAGHLTENGSLLVLEPALRPVSRELHAVRDLLGSDPEPPHIVAPCLRTGPCPALDDPRDWCHEHLPMMLPDTVREVAAAAGLRGRDLTYSYLTLARTLGHLAPTRPAEQVYRVVSEAMPTKGKLDMFVCGARGRLRLTRLRRHRTDGNAALDDGARGALIELDPPPNQEGPVRVDNKTQVTMLRQWDDAGPEPD